MTDAFITPDYYIYFRSTRIKWACELGLETSKRRPNVIFGDPEFRTVKSSDYSIAVDLYQWMQFMTKITSLMRDDLEAQKTIMKYAFKLLRGYEAELSKCEQLYLVNHKLRKESVELLFEYYTAVNCFSFINMSIPVNYYDQLISMYIPTGEVTCDSLLHPMVVPDRILLREEMIREALRFLDFGECKCDRLKQVIAYASFDRWIFQDEFSGEHILLKKEIDAMVKAHGKKGLQEELAKYELARKKQNMNILKLIAYIGEKAVELSGIDTARRIMESLSFLSAAVTEEEVRHRLECRHFLLFGKVLRNLSLDVTRSSLSDIYLALQYQNS